jgi:hypothetical protein
MEFFLDYTTFHTIGNLRGKDLELNLANDKYSLHKCYLKVNKQAKNNGIATN